MHFIINWHSWRKVSFCDRATELLGGKKKKRSPFILAEQMIWLVTKVRRCECSPSMSFSAWPESATIQRGWPGAKSPPANETRSFWRATTDPKLGESPKQKPATKFNNWLAMAPYAPQYCPAGTQGPVCSAPACCTAVSPGAVLSLFSLFYDFSGNSNQCNHAWCTGWKMVSPSPLLLQPNELPFFISKSNEHQTT